MKVMTVLGTRPEIIRLSRVIALLDQFSEHTLVHTGQNPDDRLNGMFFRELEVRQPDVFLSVDTSSFGVQAGQILSRIEPVLRERKPDRLLILGDTNGGLSAIIARRMGIPVYHMEAGNRCFDFRVPEEANRRIIDHVSAVLLPYTVRSRENLLREGFPSDRVHVTGNPIYEVLRHYSEQIAASPALGRLGLEPKRYFLVTAHRAENVDSEPRLRALLETLAALHRQYNFPVICSIHPRTRSKMQRFGLEARVSGLVYAEPFGLFDFVRLEQASFCVLSDSGTVQEEACILGIPSVTIRDVTERPETNDCGANILAGCDPRTILSAVNHVTRDNRGWSVPPEYLVPHVSSTVVRIILSVAPQESRREETDSEPRAEFSAVGRLAS